MHSLAVLATSVFFQTGKNFHQQRRGRKADHMYMKKNSFIFSKVDRALSLFRSLHVLQKRKSSTYDAQKKGAVVLEQTFFSIYFTELRYRVAYFFFSLFLAFLLGTYYSTPLTHLICTPFYTVPGERIFFIFTDVTEGLYTAVNVSLQCAPLFCAPLFFYQVYSFFMPSSYQGERRRIHWFLFSTAFLFLFSLYTAALLLLPKICLFLQQFQYCSPSMEITLQARIAPAVHWSCTTFYITALLFQTPVLVAFLHSWGVVHCSFLEKHRKHAFFLLLLIAAFLSPPDISSQSILAAGGALFYELVFWCALFYRRWK